MGDVDFDQVERLLEQREGGSRDGAFANSSDVRRTMKTMKREGSTEGLRSSSMQGDEGHRRKRARHSSRSPDVGNRRDGDNGRFSAKRRDGDSEVLANGRTGSGSRSRRSVSPGDGSRRRRRNDEDGGGVDDDDRGSRHRRDRHRRHHRRRGSRRDYGEDDDEEEREKRRRLRSTSRDRRSSRRHSRSRSSCRPSSQERNLRDAEERRVAEEEAARAEEERTRLRESEQARRDDLTVLVLNLSLKAKERDIWNFFRNAAGNVRDIKVICDQANRKSKGVCYVEFYQQEAVLKALALSGHCILDQPIRVQPSQAEKNRAARAGKAAQAAYAADTSSSEPPDTGPLRLYVGGLFENLANITPDHLRQLFSPFGEITGVDVHRDPYTGRCKGYAFVQFRRSVDAAEALRSLNGLEIAGQALKVGLATEPGQRAQLVTPTATPGASTGVGVTPQNAASSLAAAQSAIETALQLESQTADTEKLDDDDTSGLLSGPNPRLALMRKLQRTEGEIVPPPAPPVVTTALMASTNLKLDKMYSRDEAEGEGPDFFAEIQADVEEECRKFGVVQKVFVDARKIDGTVWVRFLLPDHAMAAYRSLHGRYFGGNQIYVTFVSDADWIKVTSGGS